MSTQLNVFVRLSPGNSLWSYGITERHAISENMTEKLRNEKSNCSIYIIIAGAVIAKNPLHNCYGFSPNNLVVGENPNFSSIFLD